MEQSIRERMLNTYDGLSQEQLDDLESQYENLMVLLDRALEEERQTESGTRNHEPALELHVSSMTYEIKRGIMMLQMAGGNTDAFFFDCILDMIHFGIEIGKANWPIMTIPCEEAHKDD